jgi:DNA polymerase I-like protein with 3'-5' exonuclease and polymerase domains
MSESKGSNTRSLLAWDTETTGLSLRHGCRPFFLVLQKPDSNPLVYEWDVNPKNRTPIIPPEDIKDICQRFEGTQAIGFNVKFDLLALEVIGIRLWEIIGWENIHDVMLMSHAYESGGNHGLKELCVRHLGLLDDDEKRLGKITTKARAIGKRLKWDIARPRHPHFPMVKKFNPEKNPAWKADMWLPRAIAKHENRPPDDPWWTVLQNYACLDGKRTLDLFLHLQRILEREGLYEQYEKNRRLIEVTYNMERRGVSLKPQVLKTERMRYQKAARIYSQKAKDAIQHQDINLRSAEHLIEVLYNRHQLPVVELTDKKKPSTSADTLARLHTLAPPEVQTFIENIIIQRKYLKGLEYLENFSGFQINGKAHCNIKITGTAVNRMSVNDPPMQTVGKFLGGKEYWPDSINEALKEAGVNLRTVFGPAPGREWYALDYQQAHPRIFAWLSGDEEAQQVFNEGKDYYVHLAAGAKRIPPEEVDKPTRAMFKMVNLADLYGVGDAKLEKNTGMPGLKKLLAETFPSRGLFIAKIQDSALGKGHVITSGGYRLYCPDSHKLVNYTIIGTEAEIAKQGLYDCYRLLEESATPDYDPYVALQVHDELLFDFPANDPRNLGIAHQLARVMEQAALSHRAVIPVEITFIPEGSSWADGKKLEKIS